MKLFHLLLILPGTLAVRNLQFASPLQALTIWDRDLRSELSNSTARSRFLPRFRAGLNAETTSRAQLAARRQKQLQIDATSSTWDSDAASAEQHMLSAEEQALEAAYDRATAPVEQAQAMKIEALKAKAAKGSGYQFVGVVGRPDDEKAITWYARKKPSNSKWSVRLLHVNRDAILKDLFDQGKIDFFGKYQNAGQSNPETGLPIVNSHYTARTRSWKNLWNFSPTHFFSDSSGMYWRERRLRPGLYTDGNTVYESSYRYRDGRNGMHRRSTWSQFLNSPAIDSKTKQRAAGRIKTDTPDVVLEP